MIALIDGSYGIYVPQIFIERWKEFIITDQKISELHECILDIESGNLDEYWMAWDWILENCQVLIDCEAYFLYADMDLFAIKDFNELETED